MSSRVIAARPGVTVAPAPPAMTRQSTRRQAWIRRAPLLPALIFLIVVTQLPFVATLVISFLRWNALEPNNRGFAGFANYRQVFTDTALRGSVIATVILTVSVVLVSLAIGLGIALLLNRAFVGRARSGRRRGVAAGAAMRPAVAAVNGLPPHGAGTRPRAVRRSR